MTCSHCKSTIEQGIKNSSRKNKDGTTSYYMWCRPCNAERFKAYYQANKEKVRAIIYKSIGKHRHKQTAREKLNYAVRSGKIVKPSRCQDCNKKKRIQAHHTDYTKPLDVEWLCSDCHADHHVEHRALATI